MTAKHTPGPWNPIEQGGDNDWLLLANEDRWVIGFLQNGELHTEEQRANARLMSAAPDMLAALEHMIKLWTEERDVFIEGCADCRGNIYDTDDIDRVDEMNADIAFAQNAVNKALGLQLTINYAPRAKAG